MEVSAISRKTEIIADTSSVVLETGEPKFNCKGGVAEFLWTMDVPSDIERAF